jgi:hypothetical protein
MVENEINDVRKDSEFRKISFSKFQKTKVKKELLQCLVASKIEAACYWCAELVCAGHYIDIWEIIILFTSRYIHLGNPTLPTYISLRMQNFKDVMSNGFVGNELALRNNQKVRQLFGELMATLCLSKKRHVYEAVKIKKQEEFNMAHMASKLKAPNVSYGNKCFLDEDPNELFIAVNELAYHLSNKSKNAYNACYWVEWILEFQTICKKKKETVVAERRSWANVDSKYQKDGVWIIWDLIKNRAKEKGCRITSKVINALIDMFCLKYTDCVKKRRKYLIYFAISLLTELADFKIAIWSDKKVVQNVASKIDLVYKECKKNEKSPATDYLFSGVERSNLDKTLERLEKMNKLMGLG